MTARASKKARCVGDAVTKLTEKLRRELVQHVGGHPSATERELIERCVKLRLHLEALDALAASGTALDEPNLRQYLAFSDALVKALAALGARRVASADIAAELENIDKLSAIDPAEAYRRLKDMPAGVDVRRVEHIVIDPRDPRQMSDEQLEAELSRLVAQRAAAADVVVGDRPIADRLTDIAKPRQNCRRAG
jgi:hypothetical protein